MLETILALATPIGGAIAWIWHETRKAKKEKTLEIVSEAERERSYATRLEARLKARDEEIERLMTKLAHYEDPEDILKSLIDNDPGISYIKKRVGKDNYSIVRISAGYARVLGEAPEVFDGKDFPSPSDEKVYSSQIGVWVEEPMADGKFVGRKFPLVSYIVGIGDYVKR
jgi:hypothetical protein